MLSATDPVDVGFQHEPDDLTALGYLAYAMLGLGISWRQWWYDFKLRNFSLVVDLAAFVVIPPLIEPWGSGYRIASLLLATYLMLSTAIRFNWWSSIGIGALANIINIAVNFDHYRETFISTGKFDDTFTSDYIRNIIIFLILTIFVAAYSRSLTKSRWFESDILAHSSEVGSGRYELLCNVLDSARTGGGRLYWLASNSTDVEFYHAGHACPPKFDSIRQQFGQLSHLLRPAIFEIQSGRAASLWSDGLLREASGEELDHLNALGCGPHVCSLMPIRANSGEGILVFAEIVAPCAATLKSHVRLASQLSLELDRIAFHEAAMLAADTRMRNEVACELHDGVAQTLAGARFWLASLKRSHDGSPKFEAKLDQTLQALASESEHVREVIASLRAEPSLEVTVDLAGELARFIPKAAQTWALATHFEAAPVGWTVSRSYLFEFQQLLRECFSNAARHGKAQNVVIQLQGSADQIVLEVADDGFGASGEDAMPRAIVQRCQRLSGGVEFHSQPGQTVVRMMLPMENPV